MQSSNQAIFARKSLTASIVFFRHGICQSDHHSVWFRHLHRDPGMGIPLPVLILQLCAALGQL